MFGERPLWQQQGACRGLDPNMFFPGQGESTLEAKQVCWGCPVRTECLAYAQENHEAFGIWGGESERARRRERRRQQVERRGMAS